jgi:hypothetical protein
MNNKRKTTLVAVFEDRDRAERALDDLKQAGFSSNEIGFAIRGSDVAAGGMITDAEGTKDRKGAMAGAATGGMVGGALGALAALMVPGIGPVLAAGILAAAFGGAAAGAAIGGLVGAMHGLDVSEQEAEFLEGEFNQGRAIVAVRDPDRIEQAAMILRRHGGYDFEARRKSPIPTKGTLSQP